MESKTLSERNDYPGRFSPRAYLELSYKAPGTPECQLYDFAFKNLYEAISKLFPRDQTTSSQSDKIRVLDYGCGPGIGCTITAAGIPNVSEIVLAEYTARNREAVQQWLDKDPSSFNWSPYFKHVIQTLEGKTEQEIVEREERMRSLIKVVSCDITQDPPIEKGYEGPYDIVISSLCLETCCNSIEEYCAAIAKLSALVKSGGVVFLYSINIQPGEPEGRYLVGSNHFYDLNVSYDIAVSALKEADLQLVFVNHLTVPIQDPMVNNVEKFMFITAKRN